MDSAAASSPEQSHRRAFGANECTKGASILAHSEWAQSPLARASLGPTKLCSQESRGLVSAVLRPARLHCFPSQPDLPKPSSPSFSGFVLVLINQTQAIPVLLLCAVSEGPTQEGRGASPACTAVSPEGPLAGSQTPCHTPPCVHFGQMTSLCYSPIPECWAFPL